MSGTETSPVSSASPLRTALSVVSTIGPPLTIATALMIYFGWARSDTQARMMGIDVSLFGFSTQDYVLRSIRTLFLPLLALAVLGLAGVGVHVRVEQRLQEPAARPRLRVVAVAGSALGLAVAGLAIVRAVQEPASESLVIPLALAAGTAVAAYGAWLSSRLVRVARADPLSRADAPVWQSALRKLLVGTIITLALFWAVSNFATVVGRGYAQQLEASIEQLPRATAFSPIPLAIDAPGVQEERVGSVGPGENGAQYRTRGLRLLAVSGGRILLVHDGWRVGDGVVVVLPDDGRIRWQFSR